jgi:hypothetical protein
VLSLQSNSLCAAGGKALAGGLKDNQVITELNISSNRLGYKTLHDYNRVDMSGVIALADVIPDMGAMKILNISGNKLFNSADQGASVGKVLGAMLQTNSTLRELDVSNSMEVSNSPGGPRFAQELAVGLRDNGALSTFTFSGDRDDSKPVTMKTSVVEMDFGGKGLGASGAIMVAAYLPKCT